MARKLYEIEVNNENLTKTAKSKASSVAKSVAEVEAESFGILEINNASSTKKVSKKADAGYEKNVTVAKKRQIKSQISEVEDYTDFCFRKTAQSIKSVAADESLDLLDYIKEILNVTIVENNEVKKKIAKPSESGENDGLAEYYSKVTATPFYSANIDSSEIINYIKEVLNINVESKDDVEMKIITPSVSSENDGLAEYYYNKVVGSIDEKDMDYYAIIEYIKDILNYTADENESYVAAAEEVVEEAPKKAKKVAKATTKSTTKTTTKKACKKKETSKVDAIKEACTYALSEDAERILSVARMGALFDLEKTMLN